MNDTPQTEPDPSRPHPRPPFPPQKWPKPGREADLEPSPQYLAPHYRGSGKLLDRVALITGGDSGIGRAVAVLFAREGADVAILHLPAEKVDADATIAAINREGRQGLALQGDIRSSAHCKNAVRETVERFGKLDILVNNAAYQQHQGELEDVTDEQWETTFRTNIFAYFYMARAAVEYLPRGGVIINTGSITGLEGSGGLLDYSATKGAIHAFTKSLAKNLIKRGIRVNCVAPGPVWTPLNPADRSPEATAKFGADVPMRRPAQPEEIAPAFVFFASATDSSYVTGEILTLLGGDTTAG